MPKETVIDGNTPLQGQTIKLLKVDCSHAWWYTPLTPELGGRSRRISEAILVYLVSSRTARARQKSPDSEIKITQ